MRPRLPRWINLPGILVFVLVIAVWQVVVGLKIINFDYTPAPTAVAKAFKDLWTLGELGSAITHTLLVTLIASAVAIVLGIVVGFLFALFRGFRAYTSGTIDVLRTLPVVALMPVAMLIWGPITKSEVIVAAYSALWPVVINVSGGVSSVNGRLIEVARVFRLSAVNRYRKIIFPHAVPSILVGARLAVVHALVVTIVAEIILVPQGVGGELQKAQNGVQPAQMWAWVIITGLMGYLLNALLVFAARRAMPGSQATVGQSKGATL